MTKNLASGQFSKLYVDIVGLHLDRLGKSGSHIFSCVRPFNE